MELHEFHILKRKPGAQHHAATVTGAGMRRSCGEIRTAISARCQHDGVALETVDRAIFHAHGDNAAAFAIFHNQIEREIFDEEIRIIFQALLIQAVQHRVTGPVGRRGRALNGGAFAHILHVAAKGSLINCAVGIAAKRNAGMLQLVHRSRRFTHHIFDRVLVTQPVRPLDGVVHMPGPMVRRVVAKRRSNAALCRNSMRTGGKNLGDTGCFQTGFSTTHRGAQTRAAGSDNNRVIGMVDNLVSV